MSSYAPVMGTDSSSSTTTNNHPNTTDPSANGAPSTHTTTAQSLAKEVVQLLTAHQSTLGVAESLTSGLIMSTLSCGPCVSAVFRGGVVAYATELKQTLLGVDSGQIRTEGVVDREVARQMAVGVRMVTSLPGAGCVGTTGTVVRTGTGKVVSGREEPSEEEQEEEEQEEKEEEKEEEEEQQQQQNNQGRKLVDKNDEAETTWGIGTTGAAGPDGQDGKEAGTVYIGLSYKGPSRPVQEGGGGGDTVCGTGWSVGLGPYNFDGGREEVRAQVVVEALRALRDAILKHQGSGEKEGDDGEN